MKTIIKLLVWGAFAGLCYGLYRITMASELLRVYDSVFLGSIALSLAAAITFSLSFGFTMTDPKADTALNKAIKFHATLFHAGLCWTIAHYWMVIMPMYCTCTVIFLSSHEDGAANLPHILLYSILSLVISLAVYVIKPSEQARTYRKAWNGISEKILQYKYTPDQSNEAALIAAIDTAEAIITAETV